MPGQQRFLLFVFTGFIAAFAASNARADLNCDHLLAAAETAISLRDQGHTLSQVLTQVENDGTREKLNAQELNLLRQIVRVSFTSEYSPREILESCKSGSLGLPKPKPKL